MKDKTPLPKKPSTPLKSIGALLALSAKKEMLTPQKPKKGKKEKGCLHPKNLKQTPEKPDTSLVSDMLTPSENEQLQQSKKDDNDFFQKEFASENP